MFLHSATRHGRVIFRPLTNKNGICRHRHRRRRPLITKLRVNRRLHHILTRHSGIEQRSIKVVPNPRHLTLFFRFRFTSIKRLTFSNLGNFRLVRHLGIRNSDRLHVRLRGLQRRLIQRLKNRGLRMKHHTPVLTRPRHPKLPRIRTIQNSVILYTRTYFKSILPKRAGNLPTTKIRLPVRRNRPLPPVRDLQKRTRPFRVTHRVNLRAFRTKPNLPSTPN